MPLPHDLQLRRAGPASRGTIGHHAKDQPADWHPGVASHLIAAVAACGPSVIVGLAGLEGIGYSGLSVLLLVRRWTRRSGGDLPLAAPQQPVRRILEANRVDRCLRGVSNVEEAMNRARRQAVVTGRVAAAQCRSGSPAPGAGISHCPSSAGPAAAQLRNVPAAPHCARGLR